MKRNTDGIVVATAVLTAVCLAAGRALAGNLDTTSPPAPTMHTLEDIYQKVAPLASPKTLSATTPVVAAGYYAATNLTEVDADLAAGNISRGVMIFGIVGTSDTNAGSAYPAPVAKTGQTNSLAEGDDGAYQKGATSPGPRFTIDATGSNVTDRLTGLMWTRNAYIVGGMVWPSALDYCNNLTWGGYDDWRLPNLRELESLVDYGQHSPCLPADHPFTNLNFDSIYWSSTTVHEDSGSARGFVFHNGDPRMDGKNNVEWCVWPVRGGQ